MSKQEKILTIIKAQLEADAKEYSNSTVSYQEETTKNRSILVTAYSQNEKRRTGMHMFAVGPRGGKERYNGKSWETMKGTYVPNIQYI